MAGVAGARIVPPRDGPCGTCTLSILAGTAWEIHPVMKIEDLGTK
jgi:hypothetical protein